MLRLFLIALFSAVLLPATLWGQSADKQADAREIVDHMEHIADAYRRMGLEAPSWKELQRYRGDLEEVLDRDNQKGMLCGFTAYTAFTSATQLGRIDYAGNDEDFPPGSLIDWLLHYSEPLVARVVAGSLDFDAAKQEVRDECLRHRFVFVLLNDIPMHEIDVPAEEECLRGGPCPHADDDDWDDWEE